MPHQTIAQRELKTNTIAKYKISTKDTGSSEVQIALLTQKINHLTAHMRKNNKDFSTQRGLLGLVGQRKRLLTYMRTSKPQEYLKLIQSLALRK